MTPSKPAHHEINYIEFTVTDLQIAKDFYSQAFDWEFTDYGPTYVGIKKNDNEFGGFSLETMVKKGGPLVILYSDKVEDSLELVKEAGGKISKDIFDFPGGKRFEFLDPFGNELGVWSK